MKVISLVPNDIGQYSAPMNTDAIIWWLLVRLSRAIL